MTKNSKNGALRTDAVYRPFRHSAVPIAAAARSTGHYRVPPDWCDSEMRKNFVELFWGFSGTGIFILDGQERRLQPERVCFYLPGDVHRIRAAADGWWEYYWLTFDGPGAEDLVRRMAIRREPFDAGPCPEADFGRLAEGLRDFSPSGQYRAGAMVYGILSAALAYGCSASGPGLADQFQRLVMKHYCDPLWDVDRAADELGVHRSTLGRKILAATGLSPGKYLHSYRIQEALSLLKGTEMPIGEVARQVGLPDQNYFAKVIRKATGATPRTFRRS